MKQNSMETKLKILVCEVENRVLMRLEAWIKAMGNEVSVCDDGIVALEIFKDYNPDILLVSQDLKSMGSLKLIEQIKDLNPNQAVIMMLDEDVDSKIFKKFIDLQVDKYLNKPIDAKPLFNTVESLAQEKLWHDDYKAQKRMLQDYKNAIDLSFSVSLHDRDGNIISANELFCATTRLEYSEAMKGAINPLQNPNEDMNLVWETLNRDRIYRDRQVFKFDNAQDHIIDVTAVAILNEHSIVSEYLVFSNDVSEVIYAARKIKQQELDKKLQKLEHIRELNETKDSFLTIFTHELKTPLNSIINFSDYVKKHLLKEDFKKRDRLVKQVSQINTSGWEMLDMITNLMDSMKLKDGKIELKLSSFSLNNAVDEVLDKYRDGLEDIKVIKSYKSKVNLFSDLSRLQQILGSLISNAMKYCRSSIAIVINANEKDFVVEVLDDGDGFADTSKVFNLFEQSSEDSMTRTAQGTGVGLFVVKKLCDIMHFDISLKSSKNLGGARVIISGEKGTK